MSQSTNNDNPTTNLTIGAKVMRVDFDYNETFEVFGVITALTVNGRGAYVRVTGHSHPNPNKRVPSTIMGTSNTLTILN